jgi:hypothetical protein
VGWRANPPVVVVLCCVVLCCVGVGHSALSTADVLFQNSSETRLCCEIAAEKDGQVARSAGKERASAGEKAMDNRVDGAPSFLNSRLLQ